MNECARGRSITVTGQGQGTAQLPLPSSTDSLGTLTPQELSHVSISTADFESAVGRVQPSAKREGFATVPDISWTSVGMCEERERVRVRVCV